jgi:hypothetical protein
MNNWKSQKKNSKKIQKILETWNGPQLDEIHKFWVHLKI